MIIFINTETKSKTHPDKTLNKLQIERAQLDKEHLQKPTANIILNGEH